MTRRAPTDWAEVLAEEENSDMWTHVELLETRVVVAEKYKYKMAIILLFSAA